MLKVADETENYIVIERFNRLGFVWVGFLSGKMQASRDGCDKMVCTTDMT